MHLIHCLLQTDTAQWLKVTQENESHFFFFSKRDFSSVFSLWKQNKIFTFIFWNPILVVAFLSFGNKLIDTSELWMDLKLFAKKERTGQECSLSLETEIFPASDLGLCMRLIYTPKSEFSQQYLSKLPFRRYEQRVTLAYWRHSAVLISIPTRSLVKWPTRTSQFANLTFA